MTTTTKVEGITIHDDGEDRETTHYTADEDLTVNIRKGWDMGGGTRQGLVVVQLGIDDYRGVHAVALEHYQCLGTPVEVLDLAIRQLEKVRLELSRIEDAGRLIEIEHNAFSLGVDAERGGLLPDGVPDLETLMARREGKNDEPTA